MVGRFVGLGIADVGVAAELVKGGEGSTQINPNHSLLVQSSWGVVFVADGMLDEVFGVAEVVVVGRSLQPNQPGVLQVEVEVDVDVIVVTGCPGFALVVVMVLVAVVVTSSLHPNHPGVLQVDVDVEDVLVVEVAVVVVSSRQPHQPGVLHVSVRVRVDVDEDLLLVVVSVPLLS